MRNGFRLVVLLASTAFAMVGCQPSAVPVISSPAPDQQTVSVSELARLLDLRVAETTPTHTILRRSGNTVMIFTHRGGSVYINAKEVGKVSYVSQDGEAYMARSLVSTIRSAMRIPEPGPGPGPGFPGVSGCIVIDAGHGGKDPGATSSLGFYEKTVNLAVARRVAYLLRQRGVRVEMTRTGDYFIELEDRAAIANRLNADLFVSIHADSSPKSSRRGFTLYARLYTIRRQRGLLGLTPGRRRFRRCDVRYGPEQPRDAKGELPRPGGNEWPRRSGRNGLPVKQPRSRPSKRQRLPRPHGRSHRRRNLQLPPLDHPSCRRENRDSCQVETSGVNSGHTVRKNFKKFRNLRARYSLNTWRIL